MSRLVEAAVRKRLNEYIYNADSFDIKGEWVYLNDAQVQRPVARWCSMQAAQLTLRLPRRRSSQRWRAS